VTPQAAVIARIQVSFSAHVSCWVSSSSAALRTSAASDTAVAPALASDGDLDTAWVGGCGGLNCTAWVGVDLAVAVGVKCVRVDLGGFQNRRVAVDAFVDGEWAPQGRGHISLGGDLVVLPLAQQSIHRVRLRATAGEVWDVAWVRAFKDSSCTIEARMQTVIPAVGQIASEQQHWRMEDCTNCRQRWLEMILPDAVPACITFWSMGSPVVLLEVHSDQRWLEVTSITVDSASNSSFSLRTAPLPRAWRLRTSSAVSHLVVSDVSFFPEDCGQKRLNSLRLSGSHGVEFEWTLAVDGLPGTSWVVNCGGSCLATSIWLQMELPAEAGCVEVTVNPPSVTHLQRWSGDRWVTMVVNSSRWVANRSPPPPRSQVIAVPATFVVICECMLWVWLALGCTSRSGEAAQQISWMVTRFLAQAEFLVVLLLGFGVGAHGLWHFAFAMSAMSSAVVALPADVWRNRFNAMRRMRRSGFGDSGSDVSAPRLEGREAGFSESAAGTSSDSATDGGIPLNSRRVRAQSRALEGEIFGGKHTRRTRFHGQRVQGDLI